MDANFLNWELTQLLPQNESEHAGCFWINSKNEIRHTDYYEPFDDLYVEAWTFEDVRLYLLEKGYELEIITEIDIEGKQRLYYYNIHFLKTLDEETDQTMYHSYEEAREQGLKYLLETYDRIK